MAISPGENMFIDQWIFTLRSSKKLIIGTHIVSMQFVVLYMSLYVTILVEAMKYEQSRNDGWLMVICFGHEYIAGWWFGTFFMFP